MAKEPGSRYANARELAEETGATAIYCSRQYEPWQRELEQALKLECEQHNIELRQRFQKFSKSKLEEKKL